LLLELARPEMAKANGGELWIELKSGARISIKGASNPDSLRGSGLDFVVLDEYGDCDPEVWPMIIRPSLSDRLGEGLFSGTPKGFNHFYDLHHDAVELDDWESFTFTTAEGGNVPLEELEAAKRDLDPAIYRQEYEASFEDLTTGLAYYNWSAANIRLAPFDPAQPLLLCCDFNVNPMAWAMAQTWRDTDGTTGLNVIDEIVLPDANTELACQVFGERTRTLAEKHKLLALDVRVYGDASGHARHSSGSSTDWSIIRGWFSQRPHYRTSWYVETSNPHVKDRVLSVNTLLLTAEGMRHRLFVDPRCKELIEDFRRVEWAQDANKNSLGRLSQKDPKRTHISDALGYCVWMVFGSAGQVGERATLIV